MFYRRVNYDVSCNWKVFVDNYLDGGYHVGIVHGDLTAGLDIDSYNITSMGVYAVSSHKIY